MKILSPWEILCYSVLFGVLIIGTYLSYFCSSYFDNNFAAEDGVVENATALLLLFSSFLLFGRFFALKTRKKITWKIGVIILALLFFFAAGEEISWGQRIFNFSSGDFFEERNLQKETNLHNLTIGETNLNKLIFGRLITIFLIVYLLILPLLYKRYKVVKTFMDSFAIPIVRVHQVAAFLVSTLVILFINSGRKWEVYEFCFALIFLLIFLNPLNKKIYKVK